MLLKELQSLALDVKVLTENKEELALKDLIEADYDDVVPQVREKDVPEEVSIDDVGEIEEVLFEDTEDVNIDDDFGFTKDMFDEDDVEIDTTIPDMDDEDLFDDDFDDQDKE